MSPVLKLFREFGTTATDLYRETGTSAVSSMGQGAHFDVGEFDRRLYGGTLSGNGARISIYPLDTQTLYGVQNVKLKYTIKQKTRR